MVLEQGCSSISKDVEQYARETSDNSYKTIIMVKIKWAAKDVVE